MEEIAISKFKATCLAVLENVRRTGKTVLITRFGEPVARVQLPHRDPADRFLVATARVFDLTLVTADKQLIKARQAPVLPNR
jgi:prevent-host-death family protein